MNTETKARVIAQVQKLRMEYSKLAIECKDSKAALKVAQDTVHKDPESRTLREKLGVVFSRHHRNMRRMREAWQKSQSLMREYGLTELDVITDTRRVSW